MLRAVAVAFGLIGAGGRNRTDETTLEEWSFTTKLHPHRLGSFAPLWLWSSLCCG